MTKSVSCVIVPRVSTTQQANQGTSLDTQQEACVRLAAQLQSPIYNIYREEGMSGSLYLSRKALQQALEDIEAGRAGIFITYEVDRAGRDVDVIRAIAKRIHVAGGRFLFAKDGSEVDYRGMGKAMLTLKGVFAELELDQIRERTMRGFDKVIRNGIQPSRTYTPYGYYIVKRTDIIRGHLPEKFGCTYRLGNGPLAEGTYVVIEEQATVVIEMFRRYAAGTSLRQLTLWLQGEGITTPRGGVCWHPGTVEYMLKNPVYKGEAANGRSQRFVDETRCLKSNPITGKDMRSDYRRPRPVEEWKVIPVEALVSKDVWDTCQKQLVTNSIALSGNPRRSYRLSGILRCPNCGRAMSGANGYYMCRDAFGHGASTQIPCHPKRYRVDEVDSTILAAVGKAARSREQFETALRAYELSQKRQVIPGSDDLDQTRRALKKAQDEERATIQAQIAGVLSGAEPRVYADLLQTISRKRKSLEENLALLMSTMDTPQLALTSAARWEEVINAVDETLKTPELAPLEVRTILKSIVERIFPGPGENAYRIVLRDGQDTVQKTSIFWANSGNCQ